MRIVLSCIFPLSRIEVLVCALVCTAPVLLLSRKRLLGSTLLAPWIWSCAALAALAVAFVFEATPAARIAPSLVAHLHYLAAVVTLSPFVALLGAKRPQHRAWQWIVFALVALLVLPSLKSLAFDGGAPPDPHAAWRWLILIIALSGFLNYLPTRQALSAGLFFCGQAILLADYLPGAIWSNVAKYKSLGLALLSAAVVTAYLLAGMRRLGNSPENRMWLIFRNAFGALWSLRVAERFNSTAAQNDWRVRLAWNGLQPTSRRQPEPDGAASQEDLPPELRPAVHQALKSLLRRFVSAEWIDAQLAPASGEV